MGNRPTPSLPGARHHLFANPDERKDETFGMDSLCFLHEGFDELPPNGVTEPD